MYEHPTNIKILYGLSADLLKRMVQKMEIPTNIEESKKVLVETLAIEFEDVGIKQFMATIGTVAY